MFTVEVSLGAIIQPAGGLDVDEGARESRSGAAAWRRIRRKHTLPWTVGGQDEIVISSRKLHTVLIKTMEKPAHTDCTIKVICSNSFGISNPFSGKLYQSQRTV